MIFVDNTVIVSSPFSYMHIGAVCRIGIGKKTPMKAKSSCACIGSLGGTKQMASGDISYKLVLHYLVHKLLKYLFKWTHK
jgi:hypothetical protein